MNVLMIVTWCTPKGREKLEAGVFHYEQSKALEKYCNVAVYYPYDEAIHEDMTKDTEWGILTYRSSFRPGDRRYNRTHLEQTMDLIVQEFKPDILHAHCAAGAGHRAVELGKKFHLPVVVTEHSPVELSGVNKPGVSRFLAGKAYKHSQGNVCVSKDSQNKLQKIYPRCKFDVIYNGIILPEYKESQHVYYRDGYLNIVIVAVLYDLEVKGMKYLLRAMALLKEQGEKVMLHHIGGGEYLEHFINMAKELGVDDICKFYGGCDRTKLYEIVNEMDFFVSASLVECSGVSVQEAMLLGKPVLGTNSGGVDSLVPYEAGHIVQKANARALAEGIVYMKEHLQEYDRNWIRTYAEESFEIDNISRRYMDYYQEVIDSFQ